MASTQTVGSAPSQSPAPEEVQAAPDAAEPAGAAGPSKSGAIAKGRKLLLAGVRNGEAERLMVQQAQAEAEAGQEAAPDAAKAVDAAGPPKAGAAAKGRKLLLAALKSGDAGRLLDQQARAEAEAAERTGPVAGEAGGGSG
uniref:Uncharacterized protein n=1 Tax=Alexandrium monilatum TaxID=311494 RepID=A0A6T0SHK6_9DINO